MLRRAVSVVLLPALWMLPATGCKEEAPKPSETEEVLMKSGNLEVKAGPHGATVKAGGTEVKATEEGVQVKTEEGTEVKANETGVRVKSTKEGAEVKATKEGAEVKATKEGAEVKTATGIKVDEQGNVKMPKIRVEKKAGRVNINVGGVKVDVPDEEEEEEEEE